MKTIFLSLFFLLIAQSMYSQDYEPSQRKFVWNGIPRYLNSDMDYFKQKDFLLGWHWGGRKKISQSLKVNQYDSGSHHLESSVLIDSNCYIIQKPVQYTHGTGDEPLNVRAIQFEPTLALDPANPSKLVKRIGDTTRPIFGFLNRRGRVLTNPADANFNRLIIDSAALVNQVKL